MKKIILLSLTLILIQSCRGGKDFCSSNLRMQFPTTMDIEVNSIFYIDDIKFTTTNDQELISSTFPTEAIDLEKGLSFYFPSSKIIFDKKEDKIFETRQNHIAMAHTLSLMLSKIQDKGENIYNISRNGEFSLKGIVTINKTDKTPICISSEGFLFRVEM